jgi:hypothetical protein
MILLNYINIITREGNNENNNRTIYQQQAPEFLPAGRACAYPLGYLGNSSTGQQKHRGGQRPHLRSLGLSTGL